MCEEMIKIRKLLDQNKTASDCWEKIKEVLKKAEPAHDRK